jgi:hypothetical protein
MDGLTHNNMKNWYESKSIWAGIGLILLGLMVYWKSEDITKSIELILTGMGLVGIRTGWQKIS